MNEYKVFPAILLMLSVSTSCATTSSFATIDEIVAQGGEVVEIRELIGDTGVTFVATNGDWFNYLGVDGRKVVKVKKTGVQKELTWRVSDDNRFCQQMFSTEKEICDNMVLIKDKDGVYNSYNKENNKPGFPFTIVSGNPEKY